MENKKTSYPLFCEEDEALQDKHALNEGKRIHLFIYKNIQQGSV